MTRHISEYGSARMNAFKAYALGNRILKEVTSLNPHQATRRYSKPKRALAFLAAEVQAANNRAAEATEEREAGDELLRVANFTISTLSERVALLEATVVSQREELESVRSSLPTSNASQEDPCGCPVCTGVSSAAQGADLLIPAEALNLNDFKVEPVFF